MRASEWLLTLGLWALVIALLIMGGIVGASIATAWLLVGLYMIAQSRSRGLLADASFMVTWPVYLALGK